MKVLMMQRRKEAVSKPDVRAALAEFQAQLEALYRRQRFKICRPKVTVPASLATEGERLKKLDLRPEIRCGGEDVGADSNC